jgi:8-oxo-dGTP diphosphatase/2-hydroxy-dATP diphosphatase
MAKKTIIQTLCVIYKHPKILLGMKKRGFGTGRWNGFGGKVKDGEDIEEAAERELQEEIGIDAQEMEKIGIINFEFKNSDEMPEVHFFKVEDWNGEPRESDEMKPQWFNIDELPFDKMWPDDKHWMPLFLDDKKFSGKFMFDKSGNISDYDLNFELKREVLKWKRKKFL